ncbi:PstS family phosphate ABC transporter substrate-binding protein [Halorussus gelatinilyticus]|uniref:PstS family phosphate ABC transporter substrate-binding protein n=1 Tax=Halorussus gelatinilyticus TaxID=2937524 RepID=A0A8U0IIV2_9EURY|nr:PstS family phosphate ABC transporter substrate-binding protein [Halorussus gelatinilyticus]UPW00009.1 PstS family phosphate ABC transporter substrate-binding protein [Halorussus gelatinilyticus]
MTGKSTRRKFLTAAGASGALALAGCVGGTGGATNASGNQNDSGSGSQSSEPTQLKAGGSSTVYPITSTAGSVWSSNPAASDEEYWGPSQYGIDTEKRLADYWAGLYGFEATGSAAPPFDVSVGLSHSGTGLEKLKNRLVDIGDSSAPVSAELPDASEEELNKYTDHVVGVDAQPIVVSSEVYEAGVKQLTAEQVRNIYTGEITNWSEIDAYDGPDKKIQAIGRAEGSGTDTAFRANMLGGPNAKMPGVDVRKGQNQQVKTVVSKSDNAIAYMALAFVDSEVPAVSLSFDGTVYKPGENLADENYPLSRDLHCYTYEGTSKKEASFLRMIISDFGQQNYVETQGYATLTDERRKKQLDNLPDTEN